MNKMQFVVVAIAILSLQVTGAEVRNRTWDRLSEKGLRDGRSDVKVLAADEVSALGGRQIPLCMIGDSITWAQQGDWWRKWLLKEVPQVAFVGTHTGRFGFSHAGEGGNSTVGVLARIDDRSRVPDAPYYHLMIGINDSSAARCEADVPRVASNTVESIWKIVDRLLARPTTRKVFLASILPARVAKRPFRDAAGSKANELMRAELGRRYPSDRVVWVEYERPIRQEIDEWLGKGDLVHPRIDGYRTIAGIFAPMLSALEPVPCPNMSGSPSRLGVAIENLWIEKDACTRPLIPGWYVVSFSAGPTEGKLSVRLRNSTDKPNSSYDKVFEVAAGDGRRCEFEFMTGYAGYGYAISPFHLEVMDAGSNVVAVTQVQVEKMRPSRKSSQFGRGVFVDAVSPVSEGEWLVTE
jgi:hypothetical protein